MANKFGTGDYQYELVEGWVSGLLTELHLISRPRQMEMFTSLFVHPMQGYTQLKETTQTLESLSSSTKMELS